MPSEYITAILIGFGALIIIISAVQTYGLLNLFKSGKYISSWRILFILMIFFSLGYLIVIYWGLMFNKNFLQILNGLIFFFGSLFVYLSVVVGKMTIVDLLQTTVSRSYLDNIIKSMADTLIVIDTDPKATIKTVNNAAMNLLGYDQTELVGNPIMTVLDQENMNILKKLSGHQVDTEIVYKAKSGEDIPVSVSQSILKDHFGNVQGIIYVAQDIRERKANEARILEYIQMLKDSELKLKELNASKDKFFSIIAHDLRNPFGAVLGFAEILYREAKELSSDEIIEYSSYILQQSRTIYDLLENLLSWSRIQTGRIEFKPEPLPLFDCVNEIVTINQSVALKKQIELAYDCAPDLNIFADRNMLLTVLRNLTSNAMKFTEPGGSVKIRATSPNDEIRISVRDSGIGMSSEDIQKLFKIDTHHSTIGTNEEKGSGLGLVLCKEFIEKHNGRIWVESQPGAGSEFIFTIPKR